MKLSDIIEIDRRIQDGAWMASETLPGVALKVRGLSSRAYENAQDATRRRLGQRQINAMSDVERQGLLNENLLDAILLDWKGLEGDDGEALPFSRDAAAEMLADPRMQLFRAAVLVAASGVGPAGLSST